MSDVTRQAISLRAVDLRSCWAWLGYLLAQPLLTLVNGGGDPQAVELGAPYLQILFLGTPFLVLNIVLNRLMQGAGDTVTPLIVTGSLNLLNIVFNYIVMFGAGTDTRLWRGRRGHGHGVASRRGRGRRPRHHLFRQERDPLLPGTLPAAAGAWSATSSPSACRRACRASFATARGCSCWASSPPPKWAPTARPRWPSASRWSRWSSCRGWR